jgi:hypothetical protein
MIEHTSAAHLTASLPENHPMPTIANSFAHFVVLCLLIFGGMAFAKFMQGRKRKQPENPL